MNESESQLKKIDVCEAMGDWFGMAMALAEQLPPPTDIQIEDRRCSCRFAYGSAFNQDLFDDGLSILQDPEGGKKARHRDGVDGKHFNEYSHTDSQGHRS